MANTDYILINREENFLMEVLPEDADAKKRLAAYHERIEKRRETDE